MNLQSSGKAQPAQYTGEMGGSDKSSSYTQTVQAAFQVIIFQTLVTAQNPCSIPVGWRDVRFLS